VRQLRGDLEPSDIFACRYNMRLTFAKITLTIVHDKGQTWEKLGNDLKEKTKEQAAETGHFVYYVWRSHLWDERPPGDAGRSLRGVAAVRDTAGAVHALFDGPVVCAPATQSNKRNRVPFANSQTLLSALLSPWSRSDAARFLPLLH
jgi:hypothetical protein